MANMLNIRTMSAETLYDSIYASFVEEKDRVYALESLIEDSIYASFVEEKDRVYALESLIESCYYFRGEQWETAIKHFAFKAILCDIHEDCRDSPKLARKCRNERRKLEGW